MKPVACLGDKHICPIHGSNAIVSVASKSTCDGLPVACVGDVTGCGATITSGSSSCITDGKQTAYVGSTTSHGGTIVSGSSKQMIPD
ncbi:hypothetical protein CEW89_12330 [Celeribacter ethanolicus]|uniref:PAAR domain-containing protein n=1 Tax=Celeribacter ethanolicus TaxID=1758178 RepID=A0A291GCK5_9RHOB|nr:hypothetical protein CEW89_12330 [Celeribacter ethanolicus]TNE64510.1 MAG: hypothetical protein EP336_14870 [Paracoccaceae bacterium]